MAVGNNNKFMLDRPIGEQLTFTPSAVGIAGTVIADDNERYIYYLVQTSATASAFYRYDTWFDLHQQLATPATQTGIVNAMTYNKSFGTQLNGKVYGSIWLLNGNGTTAYFYKYDIATNTWATMSVANIPATIGTDICMCYPEPVKNNYATTYHNSTTSNVTTGASVTLAGATTITVTALGESLASGSILRFGTFDITIGATASKGATTLTVSGVASDMATGTVLKTYDGKEIILNGAVASGATSITVYPLDQSIITGSKIKVERFAVLTASASASATSLTVSSLTVGIPASTVAPFYNQMYAVGSNATVMYRYTVGTNVWSTTSSNTSNPAIPAVTGAIGAGCAIKWLPSISTDKLYILRGGATANIYTYSLSGNTFATETFYPTTETFTTGTCVAVRSVGGVQKNIYIQKDNTGRVYKYNAITKQLEPFMTQWIYPAGTAYVGDRVCILTSPDGVDFLYLFVTGTQAVVRYALIDS